MARSMSLMFEVFEASGEMTRMLSRSRLLLALVGAPLMAPPIVAQPSVASQTMVQPAARPQFEVASVKSCKEGETVPAGQGGAKGGGRSGGSVSPGTLDMPCLPVKFWRTLTMPMANSISFRLLEIGSKEPRAGSSPNATGSTRKQRAPRAPER